MSNTNISTQDLKEIIADGNAEILVNRADSFGRSLANGGLTKTQIRNIFGEVRKIEAQWSEPEKDAKDNVRRLLLLKPRMAYQAQREPKAEPLLSVLADAVSLVVGAKEAKIQHERFGYFVDLFEAILAYHTAQEGERRNRARG
ncbi:MAG: type III-A CRISPR-associated protein Csm2 [Caldilineaceae bacterium]